MDGRKFVEGSSPSRIFLRKVFRKTLQTLASFFERIDVLAETEASVIFANIAVLLTIEFAYGNG